MSADNGIYIAEFPTVDGKIEYRVNHCQNIEDTEDNPEYYPQEFTDHCRVCKFGPFSGSDDELRIFEDRESAEEYAWDLEHKTDILEYGVCHLKFDRPLLNKTAEEASKWLDNWWKDQYLKKAQEAEAQKQLNLKEAGRRNARIVTISVPVQVMVWDGEDGLPEIRRQMPIDPITREEVIYQEMSQAFWRKFGNFMEIAGGKQDKDSLFPPGIWVYNPDLECSYEFSVQFSDGKWCFEEIIND